MKKSRYDKFRWPLSILAVIMLLLVSLGQASLATTSEVGDELIIEMDVPPIFLKQVEAGGMTFQRLIMQNAGRTEEIGRPELPTFGRYVAVPVGAQVRVEILEAQSTTQPDVLVYPAQEPLPDCATARPCAEGDAIAFDADFYTQDTLYPGEPVVIGEMGKLRDVTYAIVRFFPAQYNPARRELTLYTYLRVRVSFAGGLQDDTGGHYREITQDPYPAENYERIYRRLFSNYEAVAADIPPADAPANGTGAEFLIITAPDLARPAQDLAEWKNRRGIQTVVKTTDDTGSSSSAIGTYIQNAYDTWSPRPAYVLLLGDAELIPVHYVTVHPYTSVYSMTRTGTDLYYFTTSGIDYMPDIAGGRIPSSTEEEAQLVVDNILQYEQDPPTDATFYSNFQVAAYYQDDDTPICEADRLFTQTSEEIRDYLVNSQGKTATRCYTTNSTCPAGNTWYYYDGVTAVPADVKTALLALSDHTCVANDLQQGRFILNHRDHGLWYGWGDPDFYLNHVRDLSYATDGELPVVFSINCETGWFDSETDDGACSSHYTPSTSSFAEEWLTYGKAVAVFAASRVSYSWFNDDLVKGYYDGIWSGMLPGFSGGSPFSDNLYRLGDALGWGKAYLMSQYSEHIVRLTTMEIHHLFGDPTMEIWTDEPQDLTVSHNATASAGITSLDVNVDVTGATITAVQDGEIIGQVASSVAGNNPVALSPAASAGVLYVTVTKHNYRPYAGGVGVEAVSTISGCITDGGSGVSDVWVDFGAGVPMARTDATGCYAQVVGNGTYTVEPANERWVISPTNQVVVISGFDVSDVDFTADPYRAQMPYTEGFESGRLGPEWTVDLDSYGRVGTLDCPNSGDYALILDEAHPNLPATPSAILSVDLAGSTSVTLTFQWREAGDEDSASDGVYIRRNTSDTWEKIHNLTGGSNTYQQVDLNLNTWANILWGSPTLTEDFQIKFQQSDNFPWTPWAVSSDGIAIDDVVIDDSIMNYPPNTPSNPSPADGATGQSVDVDLSWSGGDPDAGDTVTYTVYLDTNDPPTTVASGCAGISATTCDPGTLSGYTQYYWYVVATDQDGASTTGPTWDFTTESTAGPLVYDSHVIDDDTTGQSDGDGDGIVECGETIEIAIDLYNQGVSTATGVTATVSTSDGDITVTDGASDYPDISASGTGTNSDDLVFEVAPLTSDGHIVQFDLQADASNGGPWSDTFTISVMCDVDFKVYLPLVVKDDPPPPTWVTILDEDFEGTFPGTTWQVFDNNASSGLYYWGQRDCRDNGGSYSAWSVGAGDTVLSCGDYPSDVYAWMIYGPFSLADATDVELTFDWWSETEGAENDYLFWGASTNGSNFSGTRRTGDHSSWTTGQAFDLTGYLGANQVWIAFVFRSNATNHNYEGSYVDNVLLRKNTGGASPIWNERPAPTPPSLEPGQDMEFITIQLDP